MWQNPRFDSIFTKYSHFVIFYDLHHKILTYLGILFKSLNSFIVKNDKDDPLEPLVYFISTLQDKTQILEGYRIRWQIEICFKHLKSNAAPLGESILRT